MAACGNGAVKSAISRPPACRPPPSYKKTKKEKCRFAVGLLLWPPSCPIMSQAGGKRYAVRAAFVVTLHLPVAAISPDRIGYLSRWQEPRDMCGLYIAPAGALPPCALLPVNPSMLASQAAPAFPWGVTSSSAHFQWPELPPEPKAPAWGSIFRKSATPDGHYRRTSEQIGALQISCAPGSAPANMSRSPTMTRVRYLDAPSQPRIDNNSSIMKHASRSNYTMTPDEEAILREAELSFSSKMYGAALVSSEHEAASSAFASQSLNAFRARQTATHTTNDVFQRPMSNEAIGQQMVRTLAFTACRGPGLNLQPGGGRRRGVHRASP